MTVLTGGGGTIDLSLSHSSNECTFPNLIAPDIYLSSSGNALKVTYLTGFVQNPTVFCSVAMG